MKRKDSFFPHSLQTNGKSYRKDESSNYKFNLWLCLWVPPHGVLPFSLALPAHPLSLLPPAIPSPLNASPFPLFNAPCPSLAGLLSLWHSPSLPRPRATWFPLCLLLPSAVVELNPIQFRDNPSPPSHVCVSVLLNLMAFVCSKATVLSLMSLGSGLLETLQYILLSVSGIEEGSLQVPWQALPLIRTVVKERLALAAFTPCSCKFLLLI